MSDSVTPWTAARQAFLSFIREFAHIHVHRAGDAIQPSRPLSSPAPPALNLSQHQGLFQNPVTVCTYILTRFLETDIEMEIHI